MEKTSRRPRTLQFDPLEGRTLLSTMAFNPQPAPAIVAPQASENGSYYPVEVEKDDFNNRGGKTDYDLTFLSGRYRFIQNYDMKIQKIGNRPVQGITAVDAMFIFSDRASVRVDNYLSNQRPNFRAARTVVQADAHQPGYVIKSESFSINHKTRYKLVIESGNYRFTQEFTMKIKKANNGVARGMPAVEAINYFAGKLENQVFHLLSDRPAQLT